MSMCCYYNTIQFVANCGTAPLFQHFAILAHFYEKYFAILAQNGKKNFAERKKNCIFALFLKV